MSKTAILIVDRDFLTEHVGVRRVTFHYWRQLQRSGYSVVLGTPEDGRIVRAPSMSLDRVLAMVGDRRDDAPDWVSESGLPLPDRFATPRGPAAFRWTKDEVRLADFDISVLTDPWLCRQGMPDVPFTLGIVHDMVPNLVACGALNLGKVLDIYSFAHDHDLGYQAYLKNAAQVVCVSESSRRDFIAFYRLEGQDRDRVRAIIPFIPDPGARVKTDIGRAGERKRLLLVNVLDVRKNFDGARASLERVARDSEGGPGFDVDIVGRERVPLKQVARFFDALAAAGCRARWFRQASDACLDRLYAEADALLFPSFYEGLGLPILEAQNHGVPVISSDVSSCPEINLNPDLCVPPSDHAQMAERLRDVLEGRTPVLSGPALKTALGDSLKTRNRLPF